MTLQIGTHRKGYRVAKFYQTKEFKFLEIKWNGILELSVFNDAEKIKNGERVLKQNSSNAYRQANEEVREARLEYFRSISHYFHKTKFPNQIDQVVMKLLCDGQSIKQTCIELLLLGHPTHRQTVRFIIRRYEHVWGIRFWTLQDRNLKNE